MRPLMTDRGRRGVRPSMFRISPTPFEIQLKGSVADGQIIGDIEIGDGDVINVSEGNTYLTGEIVSNGAGGERTSRPAVRSGFRTAARRSADLP